MAVRGACQKRIEDDRLDPHERLIAAAELHHDLSFDRVEPPAGPLRRLQYEPRSSTSCAVCRRSWFGSKAGEVMLLDLAGSEVATGYCLLPAAVRSGVRALVHAHRLDRLFAGTDDGHLVPLTGALEAHGRLHLVEWSKPGRERTRGYEDVVDGADDTRPFNDGITAMVELPDDGGHSSHLAIATREALLFVVRADRNGLTLQSQHALAGWTQWLVLVGEAGDEELLCVTRGGELARWSCRSLRQGQHVGPVWSASTNLLPTAVRPLSSRDGFLVGTLDGLFVALDGSGRPSHVPVTRDSVLSLATVTMRDHEGGGDLTSIPHVALGLEGGRLRVISEKALLGLLEGEEAPDAHHLSVALDDTALAIELLGGDGTEDPSSCHVLAGLHDHSLRLFHVRSRGERNSTLDRLWEEAFPGASPVDLDDALATLRASASRMAAGPRLENALRYLFVDLVLPRFAGRRRDGRAVVEHACALARGADDTVLYQLSLRMGELSGGDVGSLIRLSMACLRAMPRRDGKRWRAFVSNHLKQFHRCSRELDPTARVSALQHWARFVRKYLLLGDTFAEKRYGLDGLVERNLETGKFLDALIYATQLDMQRYDLSWHAVCRDRDGRAQEISRVDLVDDIAVVTTAQAEVVFFDGEGAPLGERLAPARGRKRTDERTVAIRTRAVAIHRNSDGTISIALAWAGESALEPGQTSLTIFRVRFAAGRVDLVEDEELVHLDEDLLLEVNGLAAVADQEAFLAGLDSSDSPLALLRREEDGAGRRWVLTRLSMADPPAASDGPRASLANPVRAVASLDLHDGTYLAAAGAADGTVRFVRFDLGGNVTSVDDQPRLFVYPITDIALVEREENAVPRHACCVGTEAGDLFCLLVDADASGPRIVTLQLWRDTHENAIVAVKACRSSGPDVPYPDPVLLQAARSGHVAIYDLGHRSIAETGVTEANNYRFAGARLDRIGLPPGLLSFAILDGTSTFVCAYPDGQLLSGRLLGSRDSQLRQRLRSRLEGLYPRVMDQKKFFGADADEDERLEICSMIRISGGALRRYVLRKQLERESWHPQDLEELNAVLSRHLEGLSPESSEERHLIKVVVTVASEKVLEREPGAILEEREGAYDALAENRRVSLICRRLAGYLLDELVQSRPGVVRLRMSVMSALFRANVFRHAALDDLGMESIQKALRRVLVECLRDDNRIVRVESLRAVAIALRNLGVLLEKAGTDEDRRRLRKRLFPDGLGSIQWLIDVFLDNFSRYRHHGEPIERSPTWSYVTAFIPLIRLFPGHTLTFCELLARRGLGDNLDLISKRLRGGRVEKLRSLIELYTVPCLRQPHARARADFVRSFQDCSVEEYLERLGLPSSQSDCNHARQLLHAYQVLAALWSVNDRAELPDIKHRCRSLQHLPRMEDRLEELPSVFARMLALARPGPGVDQVSGLRELRRRQLPGAVQLAFEAVIDHWLSLIEGEKPRAGLKIGPHVLQRELRQRGTGLVFEIDDRSQVIKVLRSPSSLRERREFRSDARLNRQLAIRYPDSFVTVPEINLAGNYFTMELCDVGDNYLAKLGTDGTRRRTVARTAALQLVRALRCLHAEGQAHGDLRAENLFVLDLGEPRFKLGDLRLQSADPIDVFRRRGLKRARADQWEDLLLLALFLYQVLTGRTFPADADEGEVAALANDVRVQFKDDPVAGAVAKMLGESPHETAEDLERALWIGAGEPPPFQEQGLVQGLGKEFDVFISFSSESKDCTSRALELYDRLMELGFLAFLELRHPVKDWWKYEIEESIQSACAYAVLVGESLPSSGGQYKELKRIHLEAERHGLPVLALRVGSKWPGNCPAKVESVTADFEAFVQTIVRRIA